MTQVTPGARGAPVAFSTVGLPEPRRVELWEDHNARVLIGLQCRTLSGASLDATEVNVQLDAVHLARVKATAHVVERNQELVRRRPSDAIALYFSLVGEAFYYHDDGVLTIRPGDLLVADADRAFLRGFSRGLEELVVKVPRGVYADLTGKDRLDTPVVVPFASGSNAVATALARAVGAATDAERAVAPDESSLLALVAALVGAPGDDPRAGVAHLHAAQVHIARHLHDPRLSAVGIAAAAGISPRHLSRVFAQAGTSVPHYVTAQRLDAARALLERPDLRDLTIAEVARRCGFVSPAHFSSAFRARFGERAVDVRRGAPLS